MEDDSKAFEEEFEAARKKYLEACTKSINLKAESGLRSIRMTRKLLTSFSRGADGTPPPQNTLLGRWDDTFGELTEQPMTMQSQVQSVILLGRVIRWYSNESGRPEEEILERLEKSYLDSREKELSKLQQLDEW
jgi:hypothetical protein